MDARDTDTTSTSPAMIVMMVVGTIVAALGMIIVHTHLFSVHAISQDLDYDRCRSQDREDRRYFGVDGYQKITLCRHDGRVRLVDYSQVRYW